MSVKFDNVELLTTEFMPEKDNNENIPERDTSLLPLAKADGSVLISERYGYKIIQINGILSQVDQNTLETRIDFMKNLFSKVNGNLDIDFIGVPRRYVATCVKHNFDRKHFNIDYLPWSAEFLVPSGEGKDTSETTALDAESKTSFPSTSSFEMLGSKAAQPRITLDMINLFTTPSSLKGIEFKNLDTGEKIIITNDIEWADNDEIVIDCLNKIVTYQDIEIDFYGVFPQFQIGTNNFQFSEGDIVNQEPSTIDLADYFSGYLLNIVGAKVAQSFQVPYTDETFHAINLILDKTLTPGDITLRIETDDGNKPSGTLVDANATKTIAVGAISTSKTLVQFVLADLIKLYANVKYWIMVKAASADASNYYTIYRRDNIYPNGNVSRDLGLGGGYVDFPNNDLGFQVLYGGEPDADEVETTVEYTKTYL